MGQFDWFVVYWDIKEQFICSEALDSIKQIIYGVLSQELPQSPLFLLNIAK